MLNRLVVELLVDTLINLLIELSGLHAIFNRASTWSIALRTAGSYCSPDALSALPIALALSSVPSSDEAAFLSVLLAAFFVALAFGEVAFFSPLVPLVPPARGGTRYISRVATSPADSDGSDAAGEDPGYSDS